MHSAHCPWLTLEYVIDHNVRLNMLENSIIFCLSGSASCKVAASTFWNPGTQ